MHFLRTYTLQILLLFIPSLLFQTIGKKKFGIKNHFLCGLQALFICSQILLIASLLGSFGKSFVGLFLSLSYFDFLLFQKSRVRLELSYLKFLRKGKIFADSVSKTDTLSFLAGFVIILLMVASIFPPVESSSLALFYARLVALGFILIFRANPDAEYHLSPIFFLYEKELYRIGKFYFASLSKKEKQNTFLPGCENYTHLDPKFPLLKYTNGFHGEKNFTYEKKSKDPNIIFLFMESFRAKDVGELGGKWNVTPEFDKLAKQGAFFSNFYSNSVTTANAAISSLFGIPAPIDTSRNATKVPLISIAKLLKEKGYKTSYLHNGSLNFENKMEFFPANGFDHMIGKNEIFSKYPEAEKMSWGIPDEYLMQYSAQYLEKQSQPSFLTLFTVSNHHPWHVPIHFHKKIFPSHLDKNYQKFLSSMHYSDYCLGMFIELLKKKNLLDNTLLFILGDHGQSVLEKEQHFAVMKDISSENVHIPLLIYGKDQIKPTIVREPSSQIDLLPTVMDLLQIRGVNHSIGTSLLRSNPKRHVFFHNPSPFGKIGKRDGDYIAEIDQQLKYFKIYSATSSENKQDELAHARLKGELISYKSTFQKLYGNDKIAPKSTNSFSLQLENEKSHEVILSKLQKADNLYSLSLKAVNPITNEIIDAICTHKSLIKLNLENAFGITDKMLRKILENCSHLQYLNLHSQALLTENILEDIFSLERLEELNLTNCSFVQDMQLNRMSSSMMTLERLYIEDCFSLTNNGLKRLCSFSPNLKELFLSSISISEKTINSLSIHCPNLRVLSLRSCAITDENLENLLQAMTQLDSLHLIDIQELTSNCIAYIKKSRIRHLYLEQLHQITESSLLQLQDSNLMKLVVSQCKNVTEILLQLLSLSKNSLRYIRINFDALIKK